MTLPDETWDVLWGAGIRFEYQIAFQPEWYEDSEKPVLMQAWIPSSANGELCKAYCSIQAPLAIFEDYELAEQGARFLHNLLMFQWVNQHNQPKEEANART